MVFNKYRSPEMPLKDVPDLLFAGPPYLLGAFGILIQWGQAHPLLSLLAMAAGPALGVAAKWFLNRHQISRGMRKMIIEERARNEEALEKERAKVVTLQNLIEAQREIIVVLRGGK